MHRRPLLKLIDDYAREWPQEQLVASKVRNLVESRPDCFERSCRPGHITASAWVVSSDQNRHLLLHHKKLDKWLQPGGHADGDPEVLEVARREVQEETGIDHLRLIGSAPLDLDVHFIPARLHHDGNILEDEHEHHDIRFLLQAESSDRITPNNESNQLGWFLSADVRRLTQEQSVLRLLEKAEARMAARI